MAKYALIDDNTGKVDNVLQWDGVTPLDFPGKTLRIASDVSPGDSWDGTKFVKKPEPPPAGAKPVDVLLQEVAAIKARLDVVETKTDKVDAIEVRLDTAEAKVADIETKLPK
jgi:hypothetical protein